MANGNLRHIAVWLWLVRTLHPDYPKIKVRKLVKYGYFTFMYAVTDANRMSFSAKFDPIVRDQMEQTWDKIIYFQYILDHSHSVLKLILKSPRFVPT